LTVNGRKSKKLRREAEKLTPGKLYDDYTVAGENNPQLLLKDGCTREVLKFLKRLDRRNRRGGIL
jgi:hypothetical protein